MRWIPVAERLPRKPDLVLVTYRTNPRHEHGGKRSVHFARYSGGQWRFVYSTRNHRQAGVTHWMRVVPAGAGEVPHG